MRQWTGDSEGELGSPRGENPLLRFPQRPPLLPPAADQQGKTSILSAAAASGAYTSNVATLTTVAVVGPAEGGTGLCSALAQEEGCDVFSTPALLEVGQLKKHIAMEFGDEYDGEVKIDKGTAVPHGRGVLRSPFGKHCYEGDFVNRSRDGYGRLKTERYTIWSKWKMNRPDLASSSRVDYVNGDKYCGFLSMQQNNAAAQQLSRTSRARMSKFSIWAQTTIPVRERWGELVGANGDRYFGQWENNMPSGFGCLTTTNGDRYVGLFAEGKFHDTGTLFLRSYGGHDHNISLLDGASFVYEQQEERQKRTWKTEREEQEEDDNNNDDDDVGMDLSAHHEKKRQKELRGQRWGNERWNGVIFDGVWEKGRFLGEGHVTLPCRSRVSADWKSVSHPTNGRVFIGSSSRCFRSTQNEMNEAGWFQCFHWEPLLCGAYEESKARRYAACAAFREQLQSASTHEEAQSVLADFCDEDTVLNALKVFRRCFYFLHGTCGRGCEIGSGLGSNKLGWCHLRNAYGGCIHHRQGRSIAVSDVDLAITDITSFVRSVVRWAAEMMGSASLTKSCSEMFIARRILDYVLRDVHDVLFNLYVHAYSDEDTALSTALERLRERTTLDDLGVVFARRHTTERLFDPYADAIHGIEQLGRKAHTFSSKLRVLMRWSKEIDLSVRLTQMDLDDESFPLSLQRGKQFDSGSADDLLPIHQYVLMKARLPHLYAHTKMLVDLSSEDIFMEFTSRENFVIITLHACTTTFVNLHPLLRDECRVLSPPSLFEDRLRTSVASIRNMATCFLDMFASPTWDEACSVSDPGDLHDIALGYLRVWLPAAIDILSATEKGVHLNDVYQMFSVVELLQSEETREMMRLDERSCPRSVALFCWLAAASVVSVLNMRVGIAEEGGIQSSDDILLVSITPAMFMEQYRLWAHTRSARVETLALFLLLPLRKETMLQPSFLHRAAALLFTIL